MKKEQGGRRGKGKSWKMTKIKRRRKREREKEDKKRIGKGGKVEVKRQRVGGRGGR